MRLGPILAATALATLVAACGQSQEKSAGGPPVRINDSDVAEW